jgi:hypothetical protein
LPLEVAVSFDVKSGDLVSISSLSGIYCVEIFDKDEPLMKVFRVDMGEKVEDIFVPVEAVTCHWSLTYSDDGPILLFGQEVWITPKSPTATT